MRYDTPARAIRRRPACIPRLLSACAQVRPRLQQPGGYTPLTQGSVHLALNLRSDLPDGHPLRTAAGERLGLGVEIVLEVDDVAAMCQHVAAQKWPLAAGLRRRPWGLTDFRVSDPDGYYWRVTSRHEKGAQP